MAGRAGNDTYVVDDQLDTIHEDVDAGIDTVESSVSWTLGKNLENLTLTGKRNINATGNELSNVLTGNAGDNTLDGAQGADSMAGGSGSDTYYVDDLGDTVMEAVDGGYDTVYTSVNTTLAANVEKGVLLDRATVLAGNDLNNTLIGNEQANSLYGGAGADVLDGAGGDDVLEGGAGNDIYLMRRGYGVDRIVENDTTVGNKDAVLFDDSVDINQLWFRRTSNDLEISLIGTLDKMIVSNWYLGSQYQVEEFKSVGGRTLMDSQVQNLVQAMASFSSPASGQTTLPANYQSNLTQVIAANWH